LTKLGQNHHCPRSYKLHDLYGVKGHPKVIMAIKVISP